MTRLIEHKQAAPSAATVQTRCASSWEGAERDFWLAAARSAEAGQRVGCDPRWLGALCDGLHYRPHVITAWRHDQLTGMLPLAEVHSRLFGRYLVALPYVNTAGIVAADPESAARMVSEAVDLADRLDVRYLELRQEFELRHPALTHKVESKVHMRLALPDSSESLWSQWKPKVRNQSRKGESNKLRIAWGGRELLPDFHRVFAHNMRDLGTPVYGKRLFRSILQRFQGDAELCVARLNGRPVSAALLVHGASVTEVPSASSLRAFNSTNANMLMYWHLLQRAVEKGQSFFDFGRSTVDSPTFRFKKQWGATTYPAVWQYYVRQGSVGEMRPENEKYQRAIRIWQRLPVWVTRLIGPRIVRGIP